MTGARVEATAGARLMLTAGPQPLLLPARCPARVVLDVVVCADALDFLRGLPDACVDMHLVSPPYDNLRKYKGYSWDFEGIARESYRVLKPGGVMVWIVGDSVVDGSESLTSFKQALYLKERAGFNLHDTMIWEKSACPGLYGSRYEQIFEYMFILSRGSPTKFNGIKQRTIQFGHSNGRKGSRKEDGWQGIEGTEHRTAEFKLMSNVWYIPTGFMLTSKDVSIFGKHSAMFPEKLAERHILTWTNPGDVVCDFFMGSGTTAKMARANGRHYIGCDISQDYIDLCRRRLDQPYTMPLPLGI